MKPISVKVNYIIHGKETEEFVFDAGSVENVRMGLNPGVEAVKPEPGAYTYSGMHDGGTLEKPKEGGIMNDLVSCVMAAKEKNNEYLTALIDEEKEQKRKEESGSPEQKKTKVKL